MADDPTLPVWAPTPSRIAALLWEHARDSQDTLGESGVLVDEPQLGAFTENTTPPLALVNELIAQACDEMSGLLEGHEPCNASLRAGATSATAYLAAALVDRAKDVQSANGESSGYATLIAQWRERGPALAAKTIGVCPFVPDPDDPGTYDAQQRPVGILPCGDPNPPRWDAQPTVNWGGGSVYGSGWRDRGDLF